MRIDRSSVLFTVLTVAALTGCNNTDGKPRPISVTLSPGGPVTLGQAQTQSFMASVQGTTNTTVTFTVEEPSGGSVTSAGVYTAPFATGVFHLKATSAADATSSARVEITVQLLSARQTVGSAGGTVVSPGGVVLDIPRDALLTDTALTLSDAVAPLPAGLHPITSMVRCEPDGTAFARPVKLRLPLPTGTSAAHLAWSRAGATSFTDPSDYEELGGAVDGGLLEASVTHCSGGGAVASSSQRVVTGLRKVVYVPPTGPRAVIPEDLSGTTIVAFPVVGGVYGRPVTGAGGADGTFSVPGMPGSGDYFLRLGNSEAYLLSDDAPDLTTPGLGRAGLVPLQPAGANEAGLLVWLDNLTPWKSADDVLEVLSPGSDTWAFWSTLFGCSVPPFLPEGATSLQEGFLPLTNNACAFGHHIDAALGDRVYLAQLQGRMTSQNQPYQALVGAVELPSFSLSDGQSATFHTSLVSLPQDHTLDCDLRVSQFFALAGAAPEGFDRGTGPNTGIGVNGQGAPLSEGAINTATADALLYGTSSSSDLRTGLMSFGVGEADQLTYFGDASSFDVVRFKFPNTGAANYGPFRVGLYQRYADYAHMCDQPVTPRLGPPTNIAINGSDAKRAVHSATTTPVFSWSPPVIGTARSYALDIYRYDLASNGTKTMRARVLSIRTARSQVPIPPGILEPGVTYSAVITTYDSPGLIEPVESASFTVATSTFVP